MNEPTRGPAGKVPLSAMLHALAHDDSRERIAVSDLLGALGDRALAALLIVLAVSNLLPVPPGAAILGMPLVFLAAQLAFGRQPWLPTVIAGSAMTWLARAERMLRPRAVMLALPPMEYLVGVICLTLAIVLVLPVPFGNMLPGAGHQPAGARGSGARRSLDLGRTRCGNDLGRGAVQRGV